jgi:hypothetical protein
MAAISLRPYFRSKLRRLSPRHRQVNVSPGPVIHITIISHFSVPVYRRLRIAKVSNRQEIYQSGMKQEGSSFLISVE